MPQDTVLGDSSTTHTLTINGLGVSSAIEVVSGSDRDWFRVELVAGQSYEFTLNGNGDEPLEDPYLELFTPSGELLSLDDDGGPGVNSRMQYTALNTGTYYLSARSYDAAGLGGYTIAAANGPPQDPLDTLDLEFTAPSFIEVYFVPAGGGANPFGDAPLRNWTAVEIDAAMAALATYSAVASIEFVQTNTRANAEFVLQLSTLESGTLGYFGTIAGVGYGAFDPAASGWSTGLHPGGLGFVTLIHEFGHGLGLDHPHYDGGDVQVMQGVTDIFEDYGDFLLNQQIFTIMSYNNGWAQGPSGLNFSFSNGHASTPMALDIAAIQQRYGVTDTLVSGTQAAWTRSMPPDTARLAPAMAS
jgi:hypothetical protein